ncbi:hypothetical protein AAEY27_08265 [Kosakonia sp. BYX6]|uniref:Uncharacterized protein n=1 Tax=Kosakonia calanthes TaxID=3139408 RepID=A0ABZ3BEE6_9ENTR
MWFHGRRSRYNLIKSSLENESRVDDYLVKKFGLESSGIALFKVARFKGRLKVWRSLFFIPAIPVYYVFQLILSLLEKKDIKFAQTDSLFLSFTASPKIVELHREYANDLPYLHCVKGTKLYFVSTLSPLCILLCYFISLYYSVRFLLGSRVNYYLHTANVFELVLFSFYLEKLSRCGVKSITLTNHYDRWITLIAGTALFDVNVIQHGLIDNEYYPAHKLDNINSLRAFSDKQIDIFNNNIYTHPVSNLNYLKANLQIDQDDKCDCLIVSNPFFIEAELQIYQQLKNGKVDVKFRPHPLFTTQAVLNEIDENDLCLNKRFPSPKVCIYRSSTLGNEYEMMGYKTIEWSEETTTDDIIAAVRG